MGDHGQSGNDVVSDRGPDSLEIWGLDVTSQGRIADLLLATSSDESGVGLLHLRSLDGGRTWSNPGTVPTFAFDPAPGHRGSDPQIVASGDRLVVAWTARGESPWGTGPIGVAVSTDGGGSWEPGGTPADDGSRDGHGFLDLAVSSEGRIQAVWLDGRDGEGQGLRFASSPDGKSWTANVSIDGSTCECCWNRLLSDEDGLSVIYRDAAPRDLRVASTSDGGSSWTDRGFPGAFGWSIEGCPHVGGALARSGDSTAALLWTGKEGSVGLFVAAAQETGWAPPLPLGGPSARHGDLAASEDGLFAVWDEASVEGGTIFTAHSSDEGKSWSEPRSLAEGRGASHPLAVSVADGVLVVWTVETDGKGGWASTLL